MRVSQVYSSLYSEGWYAGNLVTYVVFDDTGDYSFQEILDAVNSSPTKKMVFLRAEFQDIPALDKLLFKMGLSRHMIFDQCSFYREDLSGRDQWKRNLWFSRTATHSLSMDVNELRVYYKSDTIPEYLNMLTEHYPYAQKILQVSPMEDPTPAFNMIRECSQWVFRETLKERFPSLR